MSIIFILCIRKGMERDDSDCIMYVSAVEIESKSIATQSLAIVCTGQ